MKIGYPCINRSLNCKGNKTFRLKSFSGERLLETVDNNLDETIFIRSKRELLYHTKVLDLMQLDASAKVQIHIGGVYNDKEKSINRFISRFHRLNTAIKKRLVIENDDKCYTVRDCLIINKQTKIPILFDVFHHSINTFDLPLTEILRLIGTTWRAKDGLPMLDYSSQQKGGRPGQHVETIDVRDFKKLIKNTNGFDCDIMLEIKDKEKSILKAIKSISKNPLFVRLD